MFKAIGLKPNTQLLRTILGDGKIDENNRVKVTAELLVDGTDKVYAIGDCCNTAQEKMAAHAQNHGETVAENIALELKGKAKKAYKPRFQGMVIPIGSKGGVGDYNGWCLPSFAVKKFKSETLFVDMFWGVVDLKPPKVELN